MRSSVLFLLSLVMVLSLFLAACSSNTNNNGSSNGTTNTQQGGGSSTPAATNDGDGDDEPEDVTFRIAWWGGQVRHDLTLEVIKMYEDLNPHVTIEPEFAAWDDHWQILATQAASRSLPDIIQMDLQYITQYAERGQLVDLQPYFDSGVIDLTHVPESAISGGIVESGVYGLSLGSNALGVSYNPLLLEEAGIARPSNDWTYDDYEQLAYDLADKGYFLSGGINAEEFFHYFLRTRGHTLYHPDGNQLGYDNDALFVEYFGQYQRMYDAGAITPLDRAAQITTWEDGVLASGEAFADFAWSNQYVGLVSATEKPLEIMPLPGPNGKDGLFLKPSMFFSITDNSEVKEEAAKFLDFFTNNVEANRVILGERGVPISSDVQAELLSDLNEAQTNMFEYVTWAGNNSTPISPPPPIGAGEVHATLGEVIEELMYKNITIEEAAQRFRSEAEAILARN